MLQAAFCDCKYSSSDNCKGFLSTLMALRSVEKLGLLRARKRQDDNGQRRQWTKTTMDKDDNQGQRRQRTWLSTKKSAIGSIFSSKNMLEPQENSNVIRATALTSAGAIERKKVIM